jgi:flavin-dependent dehydrogenase
LAAAIAARRRGLNVTVVDHAVPPVDKVCGEGIMPDGVAAARALGIHLEDAGAFRFRGIRFVDSGKAVGAEFPTGTGLGIRRLALHRLLLDLADQAGVRMRWAVRVTGIDRNGVQTDGGYIPSRWIAGADGTNSNVRRWSGLDRSAFSSVRYGFRRHYRVAPWTDSMELHWTDGCQVYVTPIADSEVCVVVLSRNPRLRLEEALRRVPDVARRLEPVAPQPAERGAITVSRRLYRVFRHNVALVGDASGSVDAITGEGVCLAMHHATALADALAAGDLNLYQKAHRRSVRRPRLMASLMLLLDRHDRLRRRVVAALAANPAVFQNLLALHVGELSPLDAARALVPAAPRLMSALIETAFR